MAALAPPPPLCAILFPSILFPNIYFHYQQQQQDNKSDINNQQSTALSGPPPTLPPLTIRHPRPPLPPTFISSQLSGWLLPGCQARLLLFARPGHRSSCCCWHSTSKQLFAAGTSQLFAAAFYCCYYPLPFCICWSLPGQIPPASKQLLCSSLLPPLPFSC